MLVILWRLCKVDNFTADHKSIKVPKIDKIVTEEVKN